MVNNKTLEVLGKGTEKWVGKGNYMFIKTQKYNY